MHKLPLCSTMHVKWDTSHIIAINDNNDTFINYYEIYDVLIRIIKLQKTPLVTEFYLINENKR